MSDDEDEDEVLLKNTAGHMLYILSGSESNAFIAQTYNFMNSHKEDLVDYNDFIRKYEQYEFDILFTLRYYEDMLEYFIRKYNSFARNRNKINIDKDFDNELLKNGYFGNSRKVIKIMNYVNEINNTKYSSHKNAKIILSNINRKLKKINKMLPKIYYDFYTKNHKEVESYISKYKDKIKELQDRIKLKNK